MNNLWLFITVFVLGSWLSQAEDKTEKNPEPQIFAAQHFRVASVQKGSLFEKIGLKENDEIVSINGTKVDTLMSSEELQKHLDKSGKLVLEILRDGNERTLTLKVSPKKAK
jgi:S1-C subfamily serine protease